MSTPLNQFLARLVQPPSSSSVALPGQEVIGVNETVSVAASFYETIRNYLEYDEDHLFRRNAIRRILKRRFGDPNLKALASDIVHELIWARYLPNQKIPVKMIEEVQEILEKYQSLFESIDDHDPIFSGRSLWLLDMLSTEIEYHLTPPVADEALAAFTYHDLKSRVQWSATTIRPEDRDLQLYIAVHRALLKSNPATLRYRIFLLYYPDWRTHPSKEYIRSIAKDLATIHQVVEFHVGHPSGDLVFRAVQRHVVVYHLLKDIAAEDASVFDRGLNDPDAFDAQVTKIIKKRYQFFYRRLRQTGIRAFIFLFFSKIVIGLIVELPYDAYIVKTTHYFPLMTNILFHPFLLAVVSLSVRIPEQENTKKILEEMHAVVGMGGPTWALPIRNRRNWPKGIVGLFFHLFYILLFAFSIWVIVSVLLHLHFNIVSIGLFLLFLSLVLFFGVKIRRTKRDFVVVESKGNLISNLLDLFFLPIIRVGRWISMRAPRLNLFLFFLDFMIEAPFKSAIRLIEGWLAFLREKKEEI